MLNKCSNKIKMSSVTTKSLKHTFDQFGKRGMRGKGEVEAEDGGGGG